MKQFGQSQLVVCLVSALGVLATACAGVHPIHADYDEIPPGSLRVALVAEVGSRLEVVQEAEMREALSSAGVQDKDIVDGSVVAVQIHCCDGPNGVTYGYAYVPPGLKVEKNDVVEIRVALDPEAPGLDRLNVVTQVRQPAGTEPTKCIWVPANPSLWLRTLFCDWMPAERWQEVRGMGQTRYWYQAPATAQR